ncbi:MAG: VanZ family protein [Acidobacteria bacterium]|nr:VanZ family protein [Acidobacteriota bacterium]
MKKLLSRWGPAFLIMGIIFIASSTSGSRLPDFGIMNFLAMKGGHFAGYALLGAAYFHAFSRQRIPPQSRFWAAGILVVLYAISDEWHQGLTPDRYPAIGDVCIDTAGGILGIACLHYFRKRFMKSNGEAKTTLC